MPFSQTISESDLSVFLAFFYPVMGH